MCGRFVGSFSSERLTSELRDAAEVIGVDLGRIGRECDYESHPNFNLAPTQSACVLVREDEGLVAERMGWGLVPSWTKDASRASSMINARSETVTEKPSFRGLVNGHRCIVAMNGFYEWNRDNPKEKVPFFCSRADGQLLLVAGLWSTSKTSPHGRTFCILTRDSASDLELVHDRCPVHLNAMDALHWLVDPDPPLELCSPAHQPVLAIRRVSTRVNSVRNNDSSLIDEVSEGPTDDDPGHPSLF